MKIQIKYSAHKLLWKNFNSGLLEKAWSAPVLPGAFSQGFFDATAALQWVLPWPMPSAVADCSHETFFRKWKLLIFSKQQLFLTSSSKYKTNVFHSSLWWCWRRRCTAEVLWGWKKKRWCALKKCVLPCQLFSFLFKKSFKAMRTFLSAILSAVQTLYTKNAQGRQI